MENTAHRNLTFISYSHKDREWFDKLRTMLVPLVRKGSVAVWADTQILAGDKWRDEIKKGLSGAQVAVLLVSPDFLASDFIAKHELPPLLESEKAHGLTILWVHLRSSLYDETEIEEYQAAHDPTRPLESLTKAEQEQVLREICKEIKAASIRSPETRQTTVSGTQASTAIKALRPFRHQDAEIFSRLHRNRDLERCASAVMDHEFRFGILTGESGVGKSSFLQAGLWPRLEAMEHRCIYIKFTNEEPADSVRNAVAGSLRLEDLDGLNLVSCLERATRREAKPLVLLFDQFEQFFVHRKYKQDREPFITALAEWYRHRPPLPVKILVSIRGDFSDRLEELQKVMGYTIGPGQHFRLEKFEPKEAAKIIQVMAELAGLPIDVRFVEEMAKTELSDRDDGMVSPVHLQVLAWLVTLQKRDDKRAFTSKAFQKLGGVEGLLERYLAETLAARSGDVARQAALKVLLGVIDLERNARASVMTVKQLQTKLTGTVHQDETNEAVEWLAREDIRLLTPLEGDGDVAYELAHERLIPAIRKLAGKQLSDADRANQILDRRVNEWLGNNQGSRYLLSWKDWRLIRQQRPYIVWGVQKHQKEELLSKTKRRWQKVLGGLVCLSLVGALGLAWFFSPWGQIQLVKWDLRKLTQRSDQHELTIIAEGYASVGDVQHTQEIASRIADPEAKLRSFVMLAAAMVQAGEPAKSLEALVHAQEAAGQISDPRAKERALITMALAMTKLGDTVKGPAILVHAQQILEQISDPERKKIAFPELVHAMTRVGQAVKNLEILVQSKQAAEQISDLGIKAILLGELADAMAHVGEPMKAQEILLQAQLISQRIPNGRLKALVLARMAETTARHGDLAKSQDILVQAWQIAEQIPKQKAKPKAKGQFLSDDKAEAMAAVAAATARLSEPAKGLKILMQAQQIIEQHSESYDKAQALAEVAKATAALGEQAKSVEILVQAQQATEQISSLVLKAQALAEVAKATARLGEPEKGLTILLQARQMIVEQDFDLYYRQEALTELAKAAADLGEPAKSLEILEQATKLKYPYGYPKIGSYLVDQDALKAVETTKRIIESAKSLEVLTQVQHFAEQMLPDQKSKILEEVAQATARLDEAAKSLEIMARARQAAEHVSEPYSKAQSLAEVAEIEARLGNWRQARKTVELNSIGVGRALGLVTILRVWNPNGLAPLLPLSPLLEPSSPGAPPPPPPVTR